MVTDNTPRDRKRLSLRSDNLTQAQSLATPGSDQNTGDKENSLHISRRAVVKAGLGTAVVATGIGTWWDSIPSLDPRSPNPSG